MNGQDAGGVPGHAFISYVREDRDRADRLQVILERAGIKVWRDTRDIWPGRDWKIEIRRAIMEGSFAFLACFSENTERKVISYQNEELALAVDQMRLRVPGEPWLIPVRFTECALPPFDLGAGRRLDSLQYIDLFDDSWELGIARLVGAVLSILHTRGGPAGTSLADADLNRSLCASYALDEGRGEIAHDHVSGHSLRLGNSRWGGGFGRAGLAFDGSQAAATARRFLDTSASFSISAWLRLGDMNDWRTAVSQDGSTVSGFFLQYSHDDKTWAFSMLDSDSTDATPTRALATRPPRIGDWQHLVGVHDAERGQLRLYVDDQRVGIELFRAAWGASGEFVVGRALFERPADWFVGNIGQIRAWNRALTDTDVSTLV